MGPDRKKNNHDRSGRKRRRTGGQDEDGQDEAGHSGGNHPPQQMLHHVSDHTTSWEVKSLQRDGDDGSGSNSSHESGSGDFYESEINCFQSDFLRTPQGAQDLVAWYWLHSPEAVQRIRDEKREAKSAIETWRSNVVVTQDPTT